MARRRLIPLPAGVPHAERPAAPPAPGPRAGPAPIAHVAGEAAGAAAAEELAETLRHAREEGRLALDLPLEAIAADHLTRDRLPAEDEDMAALRASLRLHGQRVPIEVTPLAGALPYGLITGWRRLAALKALHAEAGDPRFATIRALIRRPEGAAAAYVAMVEENELRVGLSQYERARVAGLAAARGVFPDEEAALRALFAGASRPKRSRIRAFLEIWRALDGTLRFPAQLPERLGLRLVAALRAGQGGRIAAALDAAAPASPEAERAALDAALASPRAAARAAPRPLRPGVALEERLAGRTLTLRLTGEGVTPALAAEVRALLARLGGD
jgi:hypothetical protein